MSDPILGWMNYPRTHKTHCSGHGASCSDCDWIYTPGCGHNAERNSYFAAFQHERDTEPTAPVRIEPEPETDGPWVLLADVAAVIDRVQRYADSTQFHSREDCTELQPANGWNMCNCGLRTMQAKFGYILEILGELSADT